MQTKRFQLDLTEQEHAEMERLANLAGIKTKREFVSNALTLFRWAAAELANGRQVASIRPDGTVVKQLEMPCLSPFSMLFDEFDRIRPSPEQLNARGNRGGRTSDDLLAELKRQLQGLPDEHEANPALGTDR